MHLPNSQKGQSLIEILFTIAIFTLGVVTIGYVVLESFSSIRSSVESMQARLLAVEGVEVVRSLRDNGFENIPTGTYGIALTSGVWTLIESPDTQGKFTRTITIVDVDSEIKEVTVTVLWSGLGTQEKRVVLSTQFSNFMQTGGEAEHMDVDISQSALSASSTMITGIAIENTHENPIVIDGMIVDWSTEALLEYIALDGVTVFDASTSSPVSANTYIDISDFTLTPYSGLRLVDSIQFTGSVAGSNFMVTFVFSDGTKKHVFISL